MSKIGNFFKTKGNKAPVKEGTVQPEVETAVILLQYENGGRTIGIIKVDGIKMKRPATLRDLRRMCGEVLEDLQSINVVDRLHSMMTPAPRPPVAPISPIQPVEEKKPATPESGGEAGVEQKPGEDEKKEEKKPEGYKAEEAK